MATNYYLKGFQQCTNGHFYKDELQSCPYCKDIPQTSVPLSSDLDKTSLTGMNHEHKTIVFGVNEVTGNDDNKLSTENLNETSQTPVKRDLNRTFIAGVTDKTQDEIPLNQNLSSREPRKIVGWILSYTLDPMGVDYRIYEGFNKIGRDAENTITIDQDPTVSGEHVNILYKQGKFYIKDKMSANGTFLNGKELEVEKAYELRDGDFLRFGNTEFKFKSYD